MGRQIINLPVAPMCLRPALCGIYEAAVVVLQIHLNSLNSIVYDMYHQVFNANKSSALCPCTVCVTHNSHKKEHYSPVQHLLIGLSKGSALCSL